MTTLKVLAIGAIGLVVLSLSLYAVSEYVRWSRRFGCVAYGGTATECRARIP